MNKTEKEVILVQLKKEQKTIKELKKQYEEALKKIEEKVIILQADEQTQSKIYQIQYQEALKGQLEALLSNIQSNNYQTIDEYINSEYIDGWIGTFYNLRNQGIPIIAPINQESIIKAVQLNTKLSKPLYKSLGVNINELKKAIRNEISRGLASGLRYQDISRNISNAMRIDLNKAIRIARTEGHRVQNEAKIDAYKKAKENGADVLKQWDSSLDKRVRPSHAKVDGEIHEMDEKFSNGLMYPGDKKGKAKEVINCRCVMLERARWALNDDELETLKERAEYYGLDKSKNFEEFKKKFLEVVELEKISKKINFAVQSKMLSTKEYLNKFNKITEDPDLKREIYKHAKEILHHRSGQNGEDLYLYNLSTDKWVKSITGKEKGTPEYTQEIKNFIRQSKANKDEVWVFHNHPGSMPPSDADINSLYFNGYTKGFIFCHDGKIYEYTAPNGQITELKYKILLAKWQNKSYNEFEAQIKTMEELSVEYEFSFKELK